MFNVLLARTCVPGGPSLSPWGASLGGGLGPMCESQTQPSPLGFRIEIYDDFDVVLGSFWGRSGFPLGGHFRSSWRLFPLKLVPEPSSNRVIFEKTICHEIVRFPIFFCDFCFDMAT